MKATIALLPALATLFASAVVANSFSQSLVEKYHLKPLVAHQAPLANTQGRFTIAMVFQPDCPWCKKQASWLNNAQAQCSDKLNIVLLGNNGSNRELKRELKHYHSDIPAYKPNRKLFVAVGGIEASPTTLVFDAEGKLLAKRRGYTDSDTLSVVASQLTQGSCAI